jgi:protein O-mannosyl-transferase
MILGAPQLRARKCGMSAHTAGLALQADLYWLKPSATQILMDNGQPLPSPYRLRSLLLCYSIVACIACIAFLPSLNQGFVEWDDDSYVINNPDITALTLDNLTTVFSSSYLGNYQPLTMLTYMAEFHFFRLNPTAYHSTNLALHIVNAILVFTLFLGLSRHPITSLLVALLFAVHPLRVESVAWIAERKDVLSAFFYLLSLQFYVRHIATHRARFYWLCMLSLLSSLLSKPMAVSQPFVLLLIDYLCGRRLDRKALVGKAPLFAIAAIFAIVAFLLQRPAAAIPEAHQISTLQRLCVPFYGLVFYVAKTFLPMRLCSLYPPPPDLSSTTMFVLHAAPFVVVGSALAIHHFRAHSRTLVFGSLFYVVTLLPVLQIVPIGNAIVAERYTYIPALGLYLTFAVFCRFLLKEKLHSTISKSTLSIGIGTAIVVLACATYYRCAVWRDGFSLWNDVIAKYPTAVAYNNRGVAYSIHGKYDRAIEDLDQAIRLDPKYFEAYDNRGFAHLSRRDYDLAIEDHTEAIRLNPRDALAYNDRGLAYKYKGDYARAIEDFANAIKLRPTFLLYNNRGVTWDAAGDHNRAIDDFNEATRLNPEYMVGYFNRGLAHRGAGDYDQALDDFKKACSLGHRAACRLLQRQATSGK